MRKLFWCCSAAGALTLGSLFAAAYYIGHEPDSTASHCLAVAAARSVASHPVAGLAALALQTEHGVMDSAETASAAGANEECIPEEPQPIPAEPVEIVCAEKPLADSEPQAAPIVIHEDEPMPPPYTIELSGRPKNADPACPMVMPYCTDGDKPSAIPVMPCVEDDAKKPAAIVNDSEASEFKEWMKLFEQADRGGEKKNEIAEELPLPTEEPSSEPKCQEDNRIHEHYSGCPCTTCPYTGKSYPNRAPTPKAGQEESSEEPIPHHKSLKHSEKGQKSGPGLHPTEGVDTMEYRPSDGGLNEYGRGPL